MKKILIGLLAIVAIVGLARFYYMKGVLAARYSLSDLQGMAAEANKTLPILVDAETRLDKVVASEHLLEKRYTLISAQASNELTDKLTSKLFPILKTQSCQNKQSMNFYQSGVSEAFTYSDMNGKPIATLTVNKSSCN
jgi:hypothetical protein